MVKRTCGLPAFCSHAWDLKLSLGVARSPRQWLLGPMGPTVTSLLQLVASCLPHCSIWVLSFCEVLHVPSAVLTSPKATLSSLPLTSHGFGAYYCCNNYCCLPLCLDLCVGRFHPISPSCSCGRAGCFSPPAFANLQQLYTKHPAPRHSCIA